VEEGGERGHNSKHSEVKGQILKKAFLKTKPKKGRGMYLTSREN
jgi:hypothetical protein